MTDRGGNTRQHHPDGPGTRARTGRRCRRPRPRCRLGLGLGFGISAGLQVRLQLLPQSLKAVLRTGISVRVTSNAPANGIATVSITRASAKKAHIQVGQGPSVRIGLGTVSSVKNGTVTLRLYLSKGMAKKLSRLHHVAMTVRLAARRLRQSAHRDRRRRPVLAPSATTLSQRPPPGRPFAFRVGGWRTGLGAGGRRVAVGGGGLQWCGWVISAHSASPRCRDPSYDPYTCPNPRSPAARPPSVAM